MPNPSRRSDGDDVDARICFRRLGLDPRSCKHRSTCVLRHRRHAPAQSYQRGYRRGWFSGRRAKNWNRSRGTPDDNSTIPTPINRNPKGRRYDPIPIFPKNM